MKLLEDLKFRMHCFLHPEENLRAIQKDVEDWANEKLPLRTWKGTLQHMRNEIEELAAHEHDTDTERMSKEAADVIILCLNLSGFKKFQSTDSVLNKMKINKKRVWSAPDADGVIHHIGQDEG